MENEKFIFIIGGVPGVGKTSMAGKLASDLHIDVVLSGDYLREFLRPYDTAGKITTSVYDSWKNHGVMNTDTIVKGYLDQASYLSKGMQRILKRSERDGEKILLETLYFIPEMWEGVKPDSISMAYLYVKDELQHRQKLLQRTEFTHFKESGERLADHLKEYRTIMDYTLNLCDRFSVPKIETSNYKEAYDRLLRVMMN